MLSLNCEAFQREYKMLQDHIANFYECDKLQFSVMHGNGNIFIIMDESLNHIPTMHVNSHFAREICEFFQTIRIDGISFLRQTDRHVKMTFFDRDGTEEPMCGNGLRCLALYAYDRKYITNHDAILTDDGLKNVNIRGGRVYVGVGHGREFQQVAEGQYFVFSSVPHLVLFVDDILDVDVKKCGAILRYNKELCESVGHPEGIHVNFLQDCADHVRIRTYEVGVEDETLSCGSGVAGSAFVMNRIKQLPFPIHMQTNYGEMRVDEDTHGLIISGLVEYLFTPYET